MLINSINNYHPIVELDAIKKQKTYQENSLIFTIFNSLLQTAKNLLFNSNRPTSLVKTIHQLNSNPIKYWTAPNKNFNFEDRKLDDLKLTRETSRLYTPISIKYTPIKYSPNNYKLFKTLFKK